MADRFPPFHGQRIARLEFTSALDMLDCVERVTDHMARGIGLDDDAVHSVGVAVRESVVNAIKHGNRNDATKHVVVEFATDVSTVPELRIRVRDEGEGFDPETIPNPCAPDNVSKPGGRGLFLIRSFMDDVQMQRAPEGGMEIRMTKRLQSNGAADRSVKA